MRAVESGDTAKVIKGVEVGREGVVGAVAKTDECTVVWIKEVGVFDISQVEYVPPKVRVA